MKIPIKKYQMNPSLSWEERYRQLEAHHTEETQWLIGYIKRLESTIDTSKRSHWESLSTMQEAQLGNRSE